MKKIKKNKKVEQKEKHTIKDIQKLNKAHKGPKKVPNSNGYIFELENVEKYYANNYLINNVLKDINLKIEEGKFVVILGKSGSGKTTLLNIMSGLTRATTGSVIVNGYQLINLTNSQLTNFRRQHVGYIFQEYGLLATLNVYENILTGFNLNKKDRDKSEIDEILKLVNLYEHRKKYPSELSGGQQQRVAIARTIAKKPKIIFGDEPTGAVDTKMSKIILQLLKKINKEYKTTIVIITHDENISKIADIVVHVEDGIIKNIINNSNPIEP